MLKDNLFEIESKIQEACIRAGRSRDEVTLIAVSKTKPVEDIEEALRCGIRVFGENKVQEMMEKQEILTEEHLREMGISDKIDWHMIGHLQTNKVKYLIGRNTLIHSVDSEKLLQVIERESAKANVISRVLLEINIAGEESKFGLSPEEAMTLAQKAGTLSHVKLRGLMTVAPYTEDPENNRQYFRKMHKLLIDINSKNNHNVTMDVLSMGMTGDYEVAIEEGATCIRVGTGIFGARSYTTV